MQSFNLSASLVAAALAAACALTAHAAPPAKQQAQSRTDAGDSIDATQIIQVLFLIGSDLKFHQDDLVGRLAYLRTMVKDGAIVMDEPHDLQLYPERDLVQFLAKTVYKIARIKCTRSIYGQNEELLDLLTRFDDSPKKGSDNREWVEVLKGLCTFYKQTCRGEEAAVQ